MTHTDGILQSLAPVVVLLLFGVIAAIACRAARLSPIVGYLALGIALRASRASNCFSRARRSRCSPSLASFFFYSTSASIFR